MPTNVTPQYRKLEEEYRRASDPDEQLRLLQEMMAEIPKHKGTEHVRADLKRKMAELRAESGVKKGPGSRQVSAFHVDREGAGQIVMVGMPNVGKSALVDALTGASPEVSPSPFTTWEPMPGMMFIDPEGSDHGNVQVQLVDTPPLNEEFMKPELFHLIRAADIMAIVVDLQAFPIEQYETALRLLEEHKTVPAQLQSSYRAVHPEERGVTFIPAIVLANKVDDEERDEDFAVLGELLETELPLLPISATTLRHAYRFKALVFEMLGIVRVYAKPPGKEPDFSEPFVMYRGGTVETFAGQVHRDLLKSLKSARVWGTGVYDGQTVSRDHVLHDGDLVELRT
ncbi:MAG: 50S ribosome-binding GTPase [Anaerolineae bacterium]|nr:50S ribosome-binding GTPase [Anaerolineae bacterium]